MEECVFFIPHVDESGVEAGHELLYLCQVNVAHGVCDVACLLLQGDQAAVLEKGYRKFASLYVDN